MAERSSAGFNPARREDVRLFAAVLDGDHIARGFRNRDIRAALFGAAANSRQHSAAVGRLLKRLHYRQLVGEDPAHPDVGVLPTPVVICSVERFSTTAKPGPNWPPRDTKTSGSSAEFVG